MLLKVKPFAMNNYGRVLTTSTLFAVSTLATAHSGDLNNRYGTAGTVAVAISHAMTPVNEPVVFDRLGRTVFAVQTDGKDVIGALTEKGDVDTTFGKNGLLRTGAEIYDLKIDSKNRIIVLATNADTDDVEILRYTSDGKVDKAFGSNGMVTLAGSDTVLPNSLALDASDNIVWVGSDSPGSPSLDSYVAVGRLTKRGEIDSTFAASGWTDVHLMSGDERSVGQAAAIGHDGGIFVTGYSMTTSAPAPLVVNYVMKLSSNGELDPSFRSGWGFVMTDAAVVGGARYTVANSITLDAKDNIVIAGSAGDWISFSEFFATRFTKKGNVDTTFNAGSPVLLEPAGYFEAQAASVNMDSRGNFVVTGDLQAVAGSAREVGAFRLDDNGHQDMSFGDATGFAIAPDVTSGGKSAVNARGDVVIIGDSADRKSLKLSELIGYDKRSP